MPWDWPVAVNYHEAKAYCRWKGPEYRLMTEAEHSAIRDKEVCWVAHRQGHCSGFISMSKNLLLEKAFIYLCNLSVGLMLKL